MQASDIDAQTPTFVRRITQRVPASWCSAVRSLDRRLDVSWAVVATALYWVGIGLYKLSGLTFNVGVPQTVSQFVDEPVLRSDYFRSLWYLHSQPPLFNAWMGAVQKWSPLGDATTYHLTFLLLGWLLVIALAVVAAGLGAGRRASWLIAVVVALAPPTVLFQHWFFYDYPVAVLMTCTAAAFVCWAWSRRPWIAGVTLAFAASAVLTRSMIHPVWMIVVAALILAVSTRTRSNVRRHVVACMIPMIVVASVMAKNQVLFSTPQLSSWYGYNLFRTTVMSQPPDVQKEWAAKYDLPSVDQVAGCVSRWPDVPVLANRLKSDGSPNWNWECELAHFDALADASYRVIRHEPRALAKGVIGSVELWFSPTGYWVGVTDRRAKIEGAARAWTYFADWDVRWNPPVNVDSSWVGWGPDRRFHIAIAALVMALALYACGASAMRRLVGAARGRRLGASCDRDLVIAMVALTVGLSFVIGTVFEHGENARFRFVTEPLTLAFTFAVGLPFVASKVRAARRSRLASGSVDTSTNPG